MQQEVCCPEREAQALLLQERQVNCPTSLPWWALLLGALVGGSSAILVQKHFGLRGLLWMMPLVMVGALWAYTYLHHLQSMGC